MMMKENGWVGDEGTTTYIILGTETHARHYVDHIIVKVMHWQLYKHFRLTKLAPSGYLSIHLATSTVVYIPFSINDNFNKESRRQHSAPSRADFDCPADDNNLIQLLY